MSAPASRRFSLRLIGGSFLLAVLCLDVFWVKLPEELHNGDIAPTLKRQSLLNMFVAFGASAAAVDADDLGERVWGVAAASICQQVAFSSVDFHSAKQKKPGAGGRASLY